jgi:hypothetical protein
MHGRAIPFAVPELYGALKASFVCDKKSTLNIANHFRNLEMLGI